MKSNGSLPQNLEIEGADPYLQDWMALTPAVRLRRSWRMRRRLTGAARLHDAKTFPEF